MYGFSEARIFVGKDSVVKMFPQAQAQAEYLRYLTPRVCPRLKKVGREYYEMEKLVQPTPDVLFKSDTIKAVHKLLREQVHTRIPLKIIDTGWKEKLAAFLCLHKYYGLASLISDIYDSSLQYTVATHGDAALANVMLRHGEIVLIDPIQPIGKVPPLREVDYGKMLQSALGWEGIMHGRKYKTEHLIADVLAEVPDVKKAWFWATVHLVRILPYAKNRPDVQEWCEKTIQRYWKEIC